MKVIQFPGAEELHDKVKKTKVVKEKPHGQNEKLLLNDLTYTCPTCMTKTSFSMENMIFKSLEFYCAHCGTKHRVSNPAFSDKKTSIKQKKENNQ